MWKNYLKVAIRNTWKNKIYLSINVIGLGISMAFCLTIYLLYAYNWEFDSYYKNTGTIFRINELKQNTGRGLSRYDLAPMPMGPRVASEIAGVENQTRFMQYGENLAYEDKIFYEGIGYVDDNFFNLFPVNLKSGSFKLLKDKSQLFLTQELAKKYFGDADPVGKIMTIHYASDRSVNFTVAGVFSRIPLNSTFQFGALTNIENFLDGHEIKPDDWTIWQQPSTFLKLTDAGNKNAVAGQLNNFIKEQNTARPEWSVSRFELVGFKDAKLLNNMKTEGSNGNLRLGDDVLTVFSSMAILIFLIACFNLANTTMALMGNRVREIGVRKVMGGTVSQVFTQFMFEMSWTSFMSLIFGMAVFQWLSEAFYSLWHANIIIEDFNILHLVLAFTVLFLVTTIIAGLYPALYSKKFQPAAIFHNRIRLRGSGITSRILNALQFSFSIMVLVGGLVFLRNAEFIRSLNLGYQRENIINISTDDKTEFSLMRDKIKSDPDIIAWASTNDPLGGEYEDTYLVLDTSNVEIRSRRTGPEYLKMMNVKVTEGRLFNKDLATDYKDAVVVNQAYVDRFNLKDPIGKLVNLKDGKRYIIGVTQNVINSIFNGYQMIPEIYLPATEDESMKLVVKTTAEKKTKTFNYLADAWKEVIPYRPFSGYFQDDMVLGNALDTANNMKTIFLYLSILGGLLSLTGVFALSSLNVASRLKEIGIRKVMGATSRAILLTLNRQFFIILGISVVAGIILSYFLTSAILSIIYKYYEPVGISILLASGFLIAFMALLTTSLTIYKAAISNPARILRTE